MCNRKYIIHRIIILSVYLILTSPNHIDGANKSIYLKSKEKKLITLTEQEACHSGILKDCFFDQEIEDDEDDSPKIFNCPVLKTRTLNNIKNMLAIACKHKKISPDLRKNLYTTHQSNYINVLRALDYLYIEKLYEPLLHYIPEYLTNNQQLLKEKLFPLTFLSQSKKCESSAINKLLKTHNIHPKPRTIYKNKVFNKLDKQTILYTKENNSTLLQWNTQIKKLKNKKLPLKNKPEHCIILDNKTIITYDNNNTLHIMALNEEKKIHIKKTLNNQNLDRCIKLKKLSNNKFLSIHPNWACLWYYNTTTQSWSYTSIIGEFDDLYIIGNTIFCINQKNGSIKKYFRANPYIQKSPSWEKCTPNSIVQLNKNSLGFSNTNNTITIVTYNHEDKSWTTQTLDKKGTLLPINEKLCARTKDNGTIYLLSNNNTKKEWHKQYKLSGHSARVNKIIQLPNNRIASCSQDKTIRIWKYNKKTDQWYQCFAIPLTSTPYNIESFYFDDSTNFLNENLVASFNNKETIFWGTPYAHYKDSIESIVLSLVLEYAQNNNKKVTIVDNSWSYNTWKNLQEHLISQYKNTVELKKAPHIKTFTEKFTEKFIQTLLTNEQSQAKNRPQHKNIAQKDVFALIFAHVINALQKAYMHAK